jgi:hypothetical protein
MRQRPIVYKRAVFIRYKPMRLLGGIVVSHNNLANRMALRRR